MPVGELSEQEPVTVRPEDSVREAAKQMELRGAGCVVVLDEGAKPVGILTDRDVVVRVLRRGLDPDRTEIQDVMVTDLATVHENTSLTTALRRMRADRVRRLPVVDREGRLVGLFHWSRGLAIAAGELQQAAGLAQAQSRA